MRSIFKYMLFGLRARLGKRKSAKVQARKKSAMINAAIEHLIDGIDPNMRFILGYKKKLTQAVSTALEYIDRLVERIPGPIDFNKKAFGTNPLVNSFFATAGDLQKTFSQNETLRIFFEDPMNLNVDQGYALMCMEKKEHAGFGIGLEGDFIKKDVPRVSVNFYGHNIVSAAATEKAVREGLKNCIFDALISNAYERVMIEHMREAGIDGYRKVLDRRYKASQAWGQELTDLLLSIRADIRSKKEVTETDTGTKQETQSSSDYIETPSDRLELVKNMLLCPEKIIRLNHITMNLTRMGIKVDEASNQTSSKIELAELELDDVWRRIILIVKYPRNEMLAKNDFFSTAGHPVIK